MPKSHVRLSAGRESMNDEQQALCFFAGANSIFYGEQLLTTPNPAADKDQQLFKRLGIEPEPYHMQEPEQPTITPVVPTSNEQFYDACAS